MSFDETRITFESEGLRIEGALHDGAGALAAVVLHPHPQYGGDMDSHVVIALCRTLAEAGATTLRFNFRGAGGSEGAYDDGRGEAADALAAVAYVRERAPNTAIVLAGYSFGAAIAAAAAADVAPAALVLVSLPAQAVDTVPAGTPALIVTGERDQIAPPDSLRSLEAPGRQVLVVEGVDHFWFTGVDRLAEAVHGALRNLSTAQ